MSDVLLVNKNLCHSIVQIISKGRMFIFVCYNKGRRTFSRVDN